MTSSNAYVLSNAPRLQEVYSYSLWKKDIKSLTDSNDPDLWISFTEAYRHPRTDGSFKVDSRKKPVTCTNAEERKAHDIEKRAFEILTKSLSNFIHLLKPCTITYDLWTEAATSFGGNAGRKEFKKETLCRQFNLFDMMKNESFDDLVSRYSLLISELTSLNVRFTTKEINFRLLQALPSTDKWNARVMILKDSPALSWWKLEELIEELRACQMESLSSTSNSSSDAEEEHVPNHAYVAEISEGQVKPNPQKVDSSVKSNPQKTINKVKSTPQKTINKVESNPKKTESTGESTPEKVKVQVECAKNKEVAKDETVYANFFEKVKAKRNAQSFHFASSIPTFSKGENSKREKPAFTPLNKKKTSSVWVATSSKPHSPHSNCTTTCSSKTCPSQDFVEPRTCFYCHHKGHLVRECQILAKVRLRKKEARVDTHVFHKHSVSKHVSRFPSNNRRRVHQSYKHKTEIISKGSTTNAPSPVSPEYSKNSKLADIIIIDEFGRPKSIKAWIPISN